MSRVLVLGGTGFVGPFVVKQLVDRGDEVTLFHRGRREPPLTAGARHVHGEFARLAQHVGDLGEPDVVIDVNPGLGKAGHGMHHFVRTAKRGIVLTSMDVYRAMSVLWDVEGAQRPQPMPVTEEGELRTRSSPDLGPELEFDNLEVERQVAGLAQELPVTVLRCAVIYGPFDPQRRLRPYVRRMVDGRPTILLDARLARLRMSRGYVENIAGAVVSAVHDQRAAGRTYNVGEPDPLSEADWVRAIGAAVGWDGDVVAADPAALPNELQAPLPKQDLIGDTSRIRRELAYAEEIPRAEGLQRAVAWERAQQVGEPPLDYTSENVVLSAAATPPDRPRSG